jgi:hypothetical protein
MVGKAVLFLISIAALSSWAAGRPLPTDPSEDAQFLTLSTGEDLTQINVRGRRLSLAQGSGGAMSPADQQKFKGLVEWTQREIETPLQWVLMDLGSGRVVAQSRSSQLKIFGASVSKLFVAGALLNKTRGRLSSAQFQLLADMLVVSDNVAWSKIQREEIGGGDNARGQDYIHRFTQGLGYQRTRGFSGWLGDLHGNELTALELARFLSDTYRDRYPGAEILWKMIFTERNGQQRGRRFIPGSIAVGGKTGTYAGPTVDPETGSDKNKDGSPYRVDVRHHAIVFPKNGRVYAVTVLNNTGSEQNAAVLAGGLFHSIP